MTYFEGGELGAGLSTMVVVVTGVASLEGCTVPALVSSRGMFAFSLAAVASPAAQV